MDAFYILIKKMNRIEMREQTMIYLRKEAVIEAAGKEYES